MDVATVNDADRIVDLVESVYRGDSSQVGWTTEAHLLGGQRVDKNMVCSMLQKPESSLLVFRDGERIDACVYLENEPEGVHLGLLSVRGQLQGQKMGQRVLQFCESYISSRWQKSKLIIEVLWQREELIAWYERRGFQKTGVQKPFPSDPRFGLPKVNDLYFLEMTKNTRK